ncbi:MAG TPA: ABC-type transport auxiliary lipoprotein family protein [Usitatibacter sp.]|nr:ABC-type transport auxiliary lipoprotein family protein [Usitatibacter sp.]
MRNGAWLLAATALAACTSLGPREAERYFVLEAVAPPAAARAPAKEGIDVAPTTASSFYDTQSIAFSRGAGTREYYQFNHWTERPQRAIHALLASRLRTDAARGTLVLDTQVDEIYHDAVVPPGVARVSISAELSDAATRTRIARRSFTRSVPAPAYDAEGAVQGFDLAVASLVEEIAAWAEDQAAARRR